MFISLTLLISLHNVYAALIEQDIGSKNYDGCKQACEDLGTTLATAAQILSELGGAQGGDSWTPIIDTYNDWLQIGGRTWQYALRFTEINGGTLGTPQWGSRTRERAFKKVFYCNSDGSSTKVTPAPVTPAPTKPETTLTPEVPGATIDCCAKRCRKAWNTLSQTERNKYIYGFKQLADQGVIQELSSTHRISAQHGQSNSYFLPWHRVFTQLLEDAIRGLGDDYKCFAMPYWDWSSEATPKEVYDGAELMIMNSGLGIDSNGECQNSGCPFDQGSYESESPSHYDNEGTKCMIRDLDYTSGHTGFGYCWFETPDELLGIIGDSSDYGIFSGELHNDPHAYPHICVGGNMGTFYSPDDPIFYLHHTFIDYIWALWQDCHDYEGVLASTSAFNGELSGTMYYTPYTSDTYTPADVLDIAASDIIYEKGPLFATIEVENSEDCPGTVNSNWFNDFLGRRRLIRGNIARRRRRRRARNKGTGLKKRIKFRPFKREQRALQELLGQDEELNIEVEECTNGKSACPVPDNFEDCSAMTDDEVNALTLEDIISMEGINDCQKATREGIYIWAKEMGYLRSLCNGCLDPICDRSIKKDRCAIGN